MKYSQIIAVSSLFLALTACNENVEIVNGEVPNEALTYVQQVAGAYDGSFAHRKNVLNLELVGNRPVFTATEDLIDPRCESKIGDLKSVQIKEKDGKVTVKQAVFAFNPNHCTLIEGRELILNFKKGDPAKLTFDVRLLDHYVYDNFCDWPFNPNNPGGHCSTNQLPVYFSGRFTRQ